MFLGARAARPLRLDIALVIVTCLAISVFHLSLLTTLLTIGPLAVWWYRPRRSGSR